MFRTELTIAPATGQLPRTARVLTMGSCFADSIGSRLAAHKVDTLANPFGTVFQPLALGRLLRAAAGEEVDWQQHLVQARGRWQSYDLHGSIGADSPVLLLQTIRELVRRTGEFLRNADVLLLTLGTAWAYRLRETGELVNNCHKQSADLFVRELLTPDDIINGLAETHAYLRRINPELRFVLTVSPVRHLKDTLPLNTVSKSVLRVATHFVSDLLPGVAYFPAYELLMDDLRDYRFYAADMLHPSEVAEDYVWEKFTRTYFDADFGRFRKEWAAVQQSLAHRPLHPGAPEHRQFLDGTLEKLEQLSLRRVDVATELSEVRAQLAALPVVRTPEPPTAVEDDEERVDVGEGPARAAVDPLESAAPLGDGRPPRLSPEEFRAQRAARSGRPERGRRDGRGRNQPEQPAENEQFQTAAALADAPLEPMHSLALEETELADSDLTTAGGEDPTKKKKRRSRGGAKRTARKNALLLAAGEQISDAEPAGYDAESADQNSMTENYPTVRESESADSSRAEAGRRGGRRSDSGRVPRKELFATAVAPAGAEARATLDAELPTTVIVEPAPVAALPGSLLTADSTAPEIPNARNNRNRYNRGAGRSGVTDSEFNAEQPAASTTEAVIGSAEQLSGAPESGSEAGFNRPDRRNQSSAFTKAAIDAPATEAAGAAPGAARSSGRPRRAVSAARAEKPAIDTPVVPVADPRLIRTQVAAGRMMGSSASLIPPTATVVKPATVVVVPTLAVIERRAATAKGSKTPKTVAAPKAEVPVAPVAVISPPQPVAPAAKPKIAARQKAAVETKAVIPEVAAPEIAAPPAKDPKRGAAKPAAAKAAPPKPAPLKKPTVETVVTKVTVPKPVAIKAAVVPKPAVVEAVVSQTAPVKASSTKAIAVKPAAKKSPVVEPKPPKSVVTKTVAAKPTALKTAVKKPATVKAAVVEPKPAAPQKAVPKPKAPKPAPPKPAAVKPKKPAKPA